MTEPTVNKACPIVARIGERGVELLAFVHPLAGKQIVKGSVELNESLEQACVRELMEESGIRATCGERLVLWESGHGDQVWGFHLMNTLDNQLPDSWSHHTEDDGGHLFTFFWQPLKEPLDGEWHPVFARAVSVIEKAVADRLEVKRPGSFVEKRRSLKLSKS